MFMVSSFWTLSLVAMMAGPTSILGHITTPWLTKAGGFAKPGTKKNAPIFSHPLAWGVGGAYCKWQQYEPSKEEVCHAYNRLLYGRWFYSMDHSMDPGVPDRRKIKPFVCHSMTHQNQKTPTPFETWSKTDQGQMKPAPSLNHA